MRIIGSNLYYMINNSILLNIGLNTTSVDWFNRTWKYVSENVR